MHDAPHVCSRCRRRQCRQVFHPKQGYNTAILFHIIRHDAMNGFAASSLFISFDTYPAARLGESKKTTWLV